MSERTRIILIGLALVLLALGLRLEGLSWGLPQIYEEATPLKKAWQLWGWGPVDSFDLNPHFFRYPSLVIYLNFLGQGLLFLLLSLTGSIGGTMDYRALYVADPTVFVLTGRWIALVFGVGTVSITFALGKRIGGVGVAVIAAFILAVNTFHISRSQMIEVDIPLTFFVVLVLWRALGFMDNPGRKQAVLLGVALGLATSAKYTGAFLTLPAVLVVLMASQAEVTIPRGKHPRGKHKKEKKKPALLHFRWRELAWIGGAALVVFSLTSPFVFLDFRAFLDHLSSEKQHMEMGHFGITGDSTFTFYLLALCQRILGWPLAICGFAGMVVFTIWVRARWAYVLAAFMIPYLLVVSNWAMKADRYLLFTIPIFTLFASALVVRLLRSTWVQTLPRAIRPALGGLAALVLSTASLLAYPGHLADRQSDPRTEARLWVESQVPTGVFITTEWLGPEFLTPTVLWSLETELRNKVANESGRPLYAVQTIPLFQVVPERASPYYNHDLYRMADIFITSSAVRSRYLKEATRFPLQIAFYDTLEAHFDKIAVFESDGGSGPVISIYKNPTFGTPFAGRDSVAGPVPLKGLRKMNITGEEAFFFYTLGLNYQAFGFFELALESYELAFQYPMTKRFMYYNLAVSKVRALGNLERLDDALRFLAETKAPTRSEQILLNEIYQRVLQKSGRRTP